MANMHPDKHPDARPEVSDRVPPHPTDEQLRDETVTAGPGGTISFACYHPQWGGSSGACVVQTAAEPGACFEVTVWHDGEFPIPDDDEEQWPDRRHYCDPLQLVRFGLTVLEKQVAGARECPPSMLRELEEVRWRLRKVIAALPPEVFLMHEPEGPQSARQS